MDSGWSGEHWGACRGINVYVLVALETEDTALMLATSEVLKNRASSPQTSHYRSDDGIKHEARLNAASGLRGFKGPVIKRSGLINQETAASRGGVEEGRRHRVHSYSLLNLPTSTCYRTSSLIIVRLHVERLSWSLQRARGLSK